MFSGFFFLLQFFLTPFNPSQEPWRGADPAAAPCCPVTRAFSCLLINFGYNHLSAVRGADGSFTAVFTSRKTNAELLQFVFHLFWSFCKPLI